MDQKEVSRYSELVGRTIKRERLTQAEQAELALLSAAAHQPETPTAKSAEQPSDGIITRKFWKRVNGRDVLVEEPDYQAMSDRNLAKLAAGRPHRKAHISA